MAYQRWHVFFSKISPRIFWPVVIFAIAFLIRVWHLSTLEYDWYGDSYHHWLITRLTLENGLRYTDFKNMNLVWLPGFHYLAVLGMLVTGSSDISVLHKLNILLGSATCAILYYAGKTNFDSSQAGIASGLILAFQPWFVDLNVLGITETLSSLLAVVTLLSFLKHRMKLCALSASLGMLARYENWTLAAIIFLYALLGRKTKHAELMLIAVGPAAVVLGWSLWSYLNSGNPLAWLILQGVFSRAAANWFVTGRTNSWDIFHYYWLLNKMTMGIFTAAVVVALVRAGKHALPLVLTLFFFVLTSTEFYLALNVGEERFIYLALPFTAILGGQLLPKITGLKNLRWKRTTGVAVVLVLLTVSPLMSGIWEFEYKTYAIRHEVRTGLWLAANYTGGRVLADSPVVIYYSKLDPSRFISSPYLDWYSTDPDPEKLHSWVLSKHVHYVVWELVPYSAIWQLFPELGNSTDYKVGLITFHLVYNDVGWEHNLGVPPIRLYEIITG